MVRKCFCGVRFVPKLWNQKFCCTNHRLLFRKLIVCKEVFRLSDEDKLLRDKAIKYFGGE